MPACSSEQQRHRDKHHCSHQQPWREQRDEHGSHPSVKNRVHSLVAMVALEGTAMAAEDDPDLISKFRARSDTRNRRAQPAETTAKRGADFRTM
jgi:hypothetical protein